MNEEFVSGLREVPMNEDVQRHHDPALRAGASVPAGQGMPPAGAAAPARPAAPRTTDEVWSVRRCLTWTEGFLAARGEERARLAAEWLLSAATGHSRIELYMNHDEPLSKEELAFVHQAVVRRAQGEPLQYIVGETGFRTLTISCEPGVLIPRPETELLVEQVLTYLDDEVLGQNGAPAARERVALPWNAEVERVREEERAAAQQVAEAEADGEDAGATPDAGVGAEAGGGAEPASGVEAGVAPAAEVDLASDAEAGAAPDTAPDAAPAPDTPARFARVLEIGCGTGCISLSLAAERPGRVRCLATDIEPRAVALARKNRERAGLTNGDVAFLLGDLIAPVPENVRGTFDVLVSNPPYIPSEVMGDLPHEVADFEPALALDGGADGLDVFRRILAEAPRMLRPGGLLACELFEGSLDAAADLCRAAGMANVRIVQDLTRRPRFILATTPA